MNLSFCSCSLTPNTANIHHYKKKQTESSRLWAWAICACCNDWSLGGNQDSDKYRIVPPFYYEKNRIIINRILVYVHMLCECTIQGI